MMQIVRLERFHNARGFTLVEFLVAMAITGLVAMAAYSVFSTSNWSYMVQEDVSEAQQTVRVAADLLGKDIRAAAFGLPDPPFSLSIGGSTFTSAVSFTNSSSDSDSITILGIGREVGVLDDSTDSNCNKQGKGYICLDTLDDILTSSGGWLSERRFVTIDGITFLELETTQSNLSDNRLNLASTGSTPTLDRDYDNGDTLYVIQAITYSVDSDADGPFLKVNDLTQYRGTNQKVARNVEDIQFAYATDQDGNFEDAPSNPGEIIAVRANVVARTAHEDPKGNKTFSRPALEDRPAATSNDGYRRRVLTKVVKIRNIERTF